ncbi:uncharacterized protein LOC132193482 [Neocloeon triangulifer]|uniref:uncharacterized protein LOC132193482 n=1 Tax=Neocloeon triangulifer TaxID=2078957 RepID=UPI00286F3B77|nr:uncharacterized protein LOC132193482 [Neocloeon triangulifer]
MGSLRCPLCCNKEFPNRRSLQLHLLDTLELLKCPLCSKSYRSIIGLVQHLSLSSCSVETGVNFDEHFVTYVDCSFMKKAKQQEQAMAVSADQARAANAQSIEEKVCENMRKIHGSEDEQARGISKSEIVVPDQNPQNLLIQCSETNEIICINIEEANIQNSGAFGVLDEKMIQKSLMTGPAGNQKLSNQMDTSSKTVVVPPRKS